MVQVQLMDFEQCLAFAKTLREDVDVLQGPTSGLCDSVYPWATPQYLANGYKLRASIRTIVTEYPA